ncbi:SDR family oxidoreductase [Leptobacterium flavescens]|uniref:SDR family oxidoreductase n=1 Tax=Leptobacterium flavescens TaxID=472055 RepID=A0A6P0UPJ3_9FLAO|nr:SDR family oxidoreductase [Leptobacterium flavescens]NER13878.1 SDR family oxidoreductase [Leptobacterium flavescens]
MKKIEGKTIWITGASSGIGEGLAYALSERGCKLILSARRKEELNRVKQQCKHPENTEVLPLDLLEFDKMEAYVKEAIALFNGIDIMVHNGGISQRSLIAETDFSVDRKLIETDYLGTVALTKALLPHFVERKAGHFVTVTSLMGKFGSPYRSGYCGAKHALHGFFDVLRMEHEKDGIAVTLICPGFVQTRIAFNALTGDGNRQNTNDEATENGLEVSRFAQKMIRAMERKKYEAYIGKKEVAGIYLKRFFPRMLHRLVIRSKVR